jgi:hypothetical protein
MKQDRIPDLAAERDARARRTLIVALLAIPMIVVTIHRCQQPLRRDDAEVRAYEQRRALEQATEELRRANERITPNAPSNADAVP